MSSEALERIGSEIRSLHRYAYHSGEWATVVGLQVQENEVRPFNGFQLRLCYILEWPDRTIDLWPVNDPNAGYEFRPGLRARV